MFLRMIQAALPSLAVALSVAAAMPATAQNCTTISSTCSANEDVTTDGITISGACVEAASVVECVIADPVNTCAPLEAEFAPMNGHGDGRACEEIATTCAKLVEGQCIAWTREISCANGPEAIEDAVLEDRAFTGFSETFSSACGPEESDPTCVLDRTELEEGPETRLINALSVSREWWKKRHRYYCATGQSSNTCGELEASPICHITEETCAEENADGSCARRSLTYRCEANTGLELACDPINTCIGEECGGEEEEDTTGEFVHATAWLNFLHAAQEQNGCEADPEADLPVDQVGTGSVFAVSEDGCEREVIEHPSKCLQWDETTGGDLICRRWSEPTTEVIGESIEFRVFTGTANHCRYTEWWSCCNRGGFNNCRSHEFDLRDKIDAGAASYLYDTCGHRTWYGLCLHREKRYCTYEGKFARVFQEQAHIQTNAQLHHPGCPGLTFQQMESLDVDQMDLSEVYEDMLDSADQPVEDLLIEQLNLQLDLLGGNVVDTFQP